MIDSSAWIQFVRKKGDVKIKTKVAALLAQKEALFTCPIYYEVFGGAKANELANLDAVFSIANRVPLNAELWDLAATHAAKLKLKGFRVPAPDLLIATVSVEKDVPVYADDEHFEFIRREVLPDLRIETP